MIYLLLVSGIVLAPPGSPCWWDCAAPQSSYADSTLTALTRNIKASLRAHDRPAFDSITLDWQHYRDLECRAVRARSEQGGDRCLARLDRARIWELQQFLPDSFDARSAQRPGLDCPDGGSTATLVECGNALIDSLEREINLAARQTGKTLSGPAKAALDSAGQIWQGYVRGNCNLQEQLFGAGSYANIELLHCYVDRDLERKRLLEDFYGRGGS